MAQRWDADRREWVDDAEDGDDGGREGRGGDPGSGGPQGGEPHGGERASGEQWWAAATQAGTVRPDFYPPGPAGTPGTPGTPAPPGVPPAPPHAPQGPPPQQQVPAWSPSPPAQPWAGGGTPPAHGGPRPGAGDSRRLLLVIVAVAVVAGGIGGGLWALTRDDTSGGRGEGGSAGPAVTVTATTGAGSDDPDATGADPDDPDATGDAGASGDEGTSADPGSPAAPAPSPGYSRSVDPLGYTVDVPVGWAREQAQGKLAPVVTYTAPGGDRRLMVFEVKEASITDSSAQAQDIAEGFKGYQYLDRRTGADWTEFSYRYDSKRYGLTQTVDHRFQAANGAPYAIIASGPAGTDLSEQLGIALGSFCPTGSACQG
ncbi:hypothetical protein AB0912_32045 [Streptomyces sp. NPDC007084]|uniref:hypothetical protein n=1 Tax=Streptomyces sp. NPDC007084 TaxID=3154313 RepID=UPI003451B2F9